MRSFFGALGSERHGSRHIDGESGGPGREACDVQTAGAHRLDLRRVRLHGVINYPFAGTLSQKVGERLEHVLIDRRILHGRVGENQRGRIAQLFRIGRHVGDEIVVFVAIKRVELPAIPAFLRHRGRTTCDHPRSDCSEACPRKPAGHVHLLLLPEAVCPALNFLTQTIRAGARAGNGMELQTHRNQMGSCRLLRQGSRGTGSRDRCPFAAAFQQ